MKDQTVIDAERQVIRCTRCGNAVPIPLGSIDWVVGYSKAFIKVHRDCTSKSNPTCWLSNFGPSVMEDKKCD